MPYQIYVKSLKIYKMSFFKKKFFSRNNKLVSGKASICQVSTRKVKKNTRSRRWICCFSYGYVKSIRLFTTRYINSKIACLRIWQRIAIWQLGIRVKINNSYSLWSLIKYGVPQGSIIGPVFRIFLCDMFFMIDIIDIASSANGNTPYSVGKNQCDPETKLQKTSVKTFRWFSENGMKANQDKCHFLLSLNTAQSFSYLLAY